MARITLDGLTKRYDETTAVDALDLEIADGEILGVVGPSGCGKTTTLRMLAGFETPTRGTVRFDGEDVTHQPPEARNVGLVFQSYALFENMTVRENVTFGPRMQGEPREARRTKAERLLSLLDIAELADRDPATLSGGQKQRVGVARALAIEPRILLLDEPMTGLDAQLKRTLRDELAALLEDLEVTALYVTHDQDEAMEMADRIAVLNDGTLEQVGTPDTLYEEPANAFVANFVGAATLLDATVTDTHLDLGHTRLRRNGFEPDATVGSLVVRPDHVHIDPGGDLSGTVEDVTYLGERADATVRLPDDTSLAVRFDPHVHHVVPDEDVSLSLARDRLHLLPAQA